jgi:hypothetical protein
MALPQLAAKLAGSLSIDLPRSIKSNKDYKTAADAVKFLTDREKFAEAYRKESIAEYEEAVKAWREINAAVKAQIAPITALKEQVKQMLVAYNVKKQQEQLAYEVSQKLKNPEKDVLIVDDKLQKIKESEFSTNSFRTITKYRVRDIKLRDCFEPKQTVIKAFIINNELPEWVESFEESSVVVRTK